MTYEDYKRLKREVAFYPLSNQRWETKKSYKITKNLVIPPMRTNGATVPPVPPARTILPPNIPDFAIGWLIHDYYCQKEQYQLADYLLTLCVDYELQMQEENAELSFMTVLRGKLIINLPKLWHKLAYKIKPIKSLEELKDQ